MTSTVPMAGSLSLNDVPSSVLSWEGLCTSSPAHLWTILFKLLFFLRSESPLLLLFLRRRREEPLVLKNLVFVLWLKATIQGTWRLPRHTVMCGLWWHQAKPTSARQRRAHFHPFGVALQEGPWVTDELFSFGCTRATPSEKLRRLEGIRRTVAA
jgi:hypothetical protein